MADPLDLEELNDLHERALMLGRENWPAKPQFQEAVFDAWPVLYDRIRTAEAPDRIRREANIAADNARLTDERDAALRDAAALRQALAIAYEIAERDAAMPLPHRFPANAPDEVIAWRCSECGLVVGEGRRSDYPPCTVDWQAGPNARLRRALLATGADPTDGAE